MKRSLALNLHVLTARLDRAADQILRAEHGVSYSRFLALYLVGELEKTTQRALAEALGVTEPSVSRMTAVLAEAGLLTVRPDPAGGNRRRLALTGAGSRLVGAGRATLDARLEALVAHSGVPYGPYLEHTERLLAALDDVEGKPR